MQANIWKVFNPLYNFIVYVRWSYNWRTLTLTLEQNEILRFVALLMFGFVYGSSFYKHLRLFEFGSTVRESKVDFVTFSLF